MSVFIKKTKILSWIENLKEFSNKTENKCYELHNLSQTFHHKGLLMLLMRKIYIEVYLIGDHKQQPAKGCEEQYAWHSSLFCVSSPICLASLSHCLCSSSKFLHVTVSELNKNVHITRIMLKIFQVSDFCYFVLS
jgi:hypothetical protein